jgi:hypothetical protein
MDMTSTRPHAYSVLDRLDAIRGLPDGELRAEADAIALELLDIGEVAIESGLTGRGKKVEERPVEGFRLLGLHRQGAKGDPSFNACRESCRELVYRTNCARSGADTDNVAQQLRLGAMVARHIVLFIDGKLETSGLGEFCCSSRNLHEGDGALIVSKNGS